MKKICLLIVMILACSLFLLPAAFADEPQVEFVTQDEYGRFQPASATPRYQACCLNGPSLVWRTNILQHIYPTGGGMCVGVNYVGDQYCQLCGHVWQSNTIYRYAPSCGLYHY